MKIDDKFLDDLVSTGYEEDMYEMILKDIVNMLSSLPKKIKLYRILFLNNINDFDEDAIGSHYSLNKNNLIQSMSSVLSQGAIGDKMFLVTVMVDKDMIDIDETISNNIRYPHEEEITLKNKGRGIQVLNIVEVNTNAVNEVSRMKEIMITINESDFKKEFVGEKVKVYYNLNKKTFSVTHKNKVVLYADYIKMKDVKFHVREGGRQKVLKDKRKNVHAFIIGELEDYCKFPCNKIPNPKGSEVITYDPYEHKSFVHKKDNTPIYNANEVEMINQDDKLFIVK